MMSSLRMRRIRPLVLLGILLNFVAVVVRGDSMYLLARKNSGAHYPHKNLERNRGKANLSYTYLYLLPILHSLYYLRMQIHLRIWT
jgi:hypothetical protein